jgi:AraC-like DNA-binding protein
VIVDILSDVLKLVRLEGAVYQSAEFAAPYCVPTSHGHSVPRKRLGAAEHLVFFQYVVSGNFRIAIPHNEIIEAHAGDFVLFPHLGTQLMREDVRQPPVDPASLMVAFGVTPIFGSSPPDHQHAVARVICGYLGFNRAASRPLLEALPDLVPIPSCPGRAPTPIVELLRMGLHESSAKRPGSRSALAKISELLFIEAMRRYTETLPANGRGWLAGVRDPYVARALGFMHREPYGTWTVSELARRVALSRSALADRFSTLVGNPPIQYLQRWRLALAAVDLSSTVESIVRVAQRTGYESESAFSRAFKREFGLPPAAWRRRNAVDKSAHGIAD